MTDSSERSKLADSTRRAVMGDEYVNAADELIASQGDFERDFRKAVNEFAFGDVWSRDELPLAQRSLVTVAMLAAMGRERELKAHLRAAFRNGCSEVEVRETLMQVALYAGIPAAGAAFLVAREVRESLDLNRM